MPSLESIRFEQEQQRARAGTPAKAAGLALHRADELLADAPGRSVWECARGCAHCCHLQVLATPAEVAWLLEQFPPTAEQRARIVANAKAASGLSPGNYRSRRIRCAFLDEQDACSIYAARPLKCRTHTSSSVAACATSDRAIPMDPWPVRVGQALHAGMAEEPEELHAALARTLA